MKDCPVCENSKEERDYDSRCLEARKILSEALEKAMACFAESESDKGRLALARYCMGYLGARFDLTV